MYIHDHNIAHHLAPSLTPTPTPTSHIHTGICHQNSTWQSRILNVLRSFKCLLLCYSQQFLDYFSFPGFRVRPSSVQDLLLALLSGIILDGVLQTVNGVQDGIQMVVCRVPYNTHIYWVLLQTRFFLFIFITNPMYFLKSSDLRKNFLEII